MRAWIMAAVPVFGVMAIQGCSSGGGGGGAASCADGGVCPSGLQCNPNTKFCEPAGSGGASGSGTGGGSGVGGGAGSGFGGSAGSGFGGTGGGFGGSAGSGFGGTGGGFGGSAGTGFGGSGGSGGGPDTCTPCLQQNCPEELGACGQSNECVQFEQCAVPCGNDQTCLQSCAAQYPNGAQLYSSVVQCAQSWCQAECF